MHIVGVNRANVKDHLAYCGKVMKSVLEHCEAAPTQKILSKKKEAPTQKISQSNTYRGSLLQIFKPTASGQPETTVHSNKF